MNIDTADDRAGGCAALKAQVGQIVLVLQGGGALGAYQAGVYEALHEVGIEPDWVIGTSIGAVNASLIAGNAPENRLKKLKTFWSRVECDSFDWCGVMPFVGGWLANLSTIVNGLPAFFRPNPNAFCGVHVPLGPDEAGYYSTSPLAETLRELVDFSLINSGAPRLTVGAANIKTAEMHYFDSRDAKLKAEHILASGALPPAFPPVRIGGDLFWDGGILSNTPVEAVFDDKPRRNSLVFTVHIWTPRGPEPNTIWDVLSREKDIQYSSRTVTHILRQKQLHRLRHVINELARQIPDPVRNSQKVRELAAYGCVTRMHVVRLIAPAVAGEDQTKDIDFSARGIRTRWAAGLKDTRQFLAEKPWEGDFDPLEGFILHEHKTDRPTATS